VEAKSSCPTTSPSGDVDAVAVPINDPFEWTARDRRRGSPGSVNGHAALMKLRSLPVTTAFPGLNGAKRYSL
jgi:hypothetical protein